MPRLFTGLEIPLALASELALLRGGLSGARWIDVENYHLTLRFIGDIDDKTAYDVAAVLETVRRQAFTVRLEELGSFRRRQAARDRRPGEAVAAIDRIAGRAGALDAAHWHRAGAAQFTPHVTLARLRGASTLAVADYLAMRGGFFSRSFEVERFVLFSSRASTGGGPYVVEAAYPLGVKVFERP